jgi:hypothetical protein
MPQFNGLGQGVNNSAAQDLLVGASLTGDGVYHVSFWTPDSTCYVGSSEMPQGSEIETGNGGTFGFLLRPDVLYEADVLYQAESTPSSQLFGTSTAAAVDGSNVAVIYLLPVLQL